MTGQFDSPYVRNARGSALFYDADDTRGPALAASRGDLNPLALKLWQEALGFSEEWDVVADIGANYGEMVLGVDLSHADRVVAFEPNPRIADLLEKSIGHSQSPVPIEVVRAAVGAAPGTAQLEIDLKWSGKSHLSGVQGLPATDMESVEVPVVSVDSFFSDREIRSACIKIDVEGFEFAVLEGAQSFLRGVSRAAVMLEILHMPVQDVAQYARRFPFYLLKSDGSGIVRWSGTDPESLGLLLHDGSVHRENAIMLAGKDVHAFDASVRERVRRSGRRVVYTALMGDYEELRAQPMASRSDVPFICFTDDPDLKSDSWDVRLVEPRYPGDSVRSARHLKIRGHDDLNEFDETIWIDNRVELLADPNETADALLADSDIAVFTHSFRETLGDEFDAVLDAGYDDADRVQEQHAHYAVAFSDQLAMRPLWTGFIVRKRNSVVTSTMDLWADHVNRYSRRDQLSFPVALSRNQVKVNRIDGDNRESEWHRWPLLDRSVLDERRQKADSFSADLRVQLDRLREIDGPMTAQVESLQRAVTAGRDEVALREKERDRAYNDRDLAIHDRDEAVLARNATRDEVGRQRRRAKRAENELRLVRKELAGHLASRGYRVVQRLRSAFRPGLNRKS